MLSDSDTPKKKPFLLRHAKNILLLIFFILFLFCAFMLVQYERYAQALIKKNERQQASLEHYVSLDHGSVSHQDGNWITRFISTNMIDYVLVHQSGDRGDLCTSEKCLSKNIFGEYADQFFGYTTVRGYSLEKPEAEISNDSCQQLVITSSEDEIIKGLADSHSWIERQDQTNNMILTISPNSSILDNNEFDLLKNSSESTPVRVLLSRRYPYQVSEGECLSLVNVLSVKQDAQRPLIGQKTSNIIIGEERQIDSETFSSSFKLDTPKGWNLVSNGGDGGTSLLTNDGYIFYIGPVNKDVTCEFPEELSTGDTPEYAVFETEFGSVRLGKSNYVNMSADSGTQFSVCQKEEDTQEWTVRLPIGFISYVTPEPPDSKMLIEMNQIVQSIEVTQ